MNLSDESSNRNHPSVSRFNRFPINANRQGVSHSPSSNTAGLVNIQSVNQPQHHRSPSAPLATRTDAKAVSIRNLLSPHPPTFSDMKSDIIRLTPPIKLSNNGSNSTPKTNIMEYKSKQTVSIDKNVPKQSNERDSDDDIILLSSKNTRRKFVPKTYDYNGESIFNGAIIPSNNKKFNVEMVQFAGLPISKLPLSKKCV